MTSLEYYVILLGLIERLHVDFLNTIKDTLLSSGNHNINCVQAWMIFNIGNSKMTIGELNIRNCYVKSNVSYNLHKLADAGYVNIENSEHDGRVILVSLSKDGFEIRDQITNMIENQIGRFNSNIIDNIKLTSDVLQRIINILPVINRVLL